MWKINDHYYELNQLPKIYKPAYGGLRIQIVRRELNGTTFQCYTQSDNEQIAVASSIGVLTVTLTSNNIHIRI